MNFLKSCIILFGLLSFIGGDMIAQPFTPFTPQSAQSSNQLPISITALSATINVFASEGGTTPTADVNVEVTSSSDLILAVRVYDYEGGNLIEAGDSGSPTALYTFSYPLAVPTESNPSPIIAYPSFWVECGAIVDGTYRRDSGCTVTIDG